MSRGFDLDLSAEARKCLQVQLGTTAGNEIAELIRRLAERVEQLEKNKVNVTPIVRTR